MTMQINDLLILEDGSQVSIVPPPMPKDGRVFVNQDTNQGYGMYDGCLDVISSTACHRGYIATWSIRDDTVYLESIEGRLAIKEPIKADWLFDELVARTSGTAPDGFYEVDVYGVRYGLVVEKYQGFREDYFAIKNRPLQPKANLSTRIIRFFKQLKKRM